MIGTQAKNQRNNKLIKMRLDGYLWNDVAAHFDLSVARSKEIFYREAKKLGISTKISSVKKNK